MTGDGGDMAARIRAHDWSATPLGPLDAWPQSLKTTVELLQGSRFPMFMAWGPDLTFIYNDAYVPILGDKHPAALGAPFQDVWAEIWVDLEPMIEAALDGRATYFENLPLLMRRKGHDERTWFTFSYSPIRDEGGGVAGMFCACVETTRQMAAERRQAALIDLDDALADLTDADAIGFVSARILGQALDASRAGYGVIDPQSRTIRIARDWTADGQCSVAGEHRFADYGTYVEDLMRGEPAVIVDVERDPRTADTRAALATYGIGALLDVPCTEDGRTIAQILVHSDRARAWTDEEVAFVRTVAERTRAAFARREAEGALRQSRAELQGLTDNLPLLVAFVDADLRYQFNNRTYEDWFGIPANALKGREVREVVGDGAFESLKPHFDRALAGEAITVEQLIPYSRGGARHTHVEYIPRRDETGRVDGFYAMVQDITARKQAEMRQQVLLDLNDAVRDLTDPGDIAHASSRILAEALNVSRVGYGVMDTAAETITIERDHNAPGVRSIAGVIHFRDFGDYIEDLARGETVIFADAANDPRVGDGGAALAGIAATSLINMPLIERGEVVALLFVNNATPREWSDADVALVREVSERVRTATERARAKIDLDASRAHLVAMFQQTATGLAETDPQGRFISVNDHFCRLLGRDRATLLAGMTMQSVTHPDDLKQNLPAFGELVSTGTPFEIEKRYIRPDGGEVWVSNSVSAIRGGDGAVETVLAVSVEITARKLAETALRENEARLRFLDDLNLEVGKLTDADDILAVTTRMTARHLGVSNCAYADMDADQDGFTIRGDWAEPGMASIVGRYRLADFGKLAVQELGAGRPLIINDVLTQIAPEEAATFQAVGISATICMPLVKAGRLTALMAIHHRRPHVWTNEELATIREVTERSWAHVERVRSEAQLRDRAAELEAVFDAVPAAIWIARDAGASSIEGNAFARRLLRMPEGANLSKTPPDPARALTGFRVLDRDGVELASDRLPVQRAARGEAVNDFEQEVVFDDGASTFMVGNARPLLDAQGRSRGAVASFVDITTRRRAELAVRESEARFRNLADSTPMMMWVTDPTGFCTYLNKTWFQFTGQTQEEAEGFGWLDATHPDDRARAEDTFLAANAAREAFTLEYRLRRADGVYRWAIDAASPRFDADGDYLGYVGSVIDIDDRREMENALRSSEAQLATLLAGSRAELDRLWELSPDLLTVVNYEGRLERINPSWTRVLGYDEETLLTRPYVEILHPDEVELIGELLAQMRASERPVLLEDRLLAADGSWRNFVWTLSPEPGGERLYGVGRDVTDERAQAAQLALAQEALRQSQKMEAVGQLTGGIAHDFNNLLAGIIGSLELLGKRLKEGRLNGMERYIDAAQGSAQRAASLTQRLLAFSRRQTLDPRPTDVNRLIAGMEDLIRRTVGPDVELEVVGAGGLWAARVDQPQLENALLNLCINARDAMAPDGGRLTIETANKWLDDRHARALDMTPGQYLSLCVTDTGSGMSAEVQVQAFDPFFTTKPLGQGTGLGLSMIHGFVRQSGGQVRIYSEVGKGTTMCLYFPRWMGEMDTEAAPALAAGLEAGHGETVLVIDDEPTVRMLVAEVLIEAGYRVLEAADGPSGLEVLRSDVRMDLLVSDVGLPGGMNGRQVADAARVIRPDLKVLFMTGYAENAAVGNGLLDPGMQVLTKPFVMADLALKVREMIEG